LNESVDFSEIPSPYLTNEILISENQKMVRWETQRGCPYKCSFCSHRDLTKNKVYKHGKDKILEELALFKTKKVKRINIIDPVFNAGKDYLAYMQHIYELGLSAELTLQTRFEMIKGETGKLFLDLSEKTNAHLEFGVQTIIPDEYNAINRPNDNNLIGKLLPELKSRNISYEISLIYGLPFQTLDTFRYSIDFLLSKILRFISKLERVRSQYSDNLHFLNTFYIESLNIDLSFDCTITVPINRISLTSDSILKFKEKKYDLIIRAGSGILDSTFFNVSKYGIISLHLGDNRKIRGSVPGFYESLYKTDEIGFIIQRISEKIKI
jgi:hypothetical protein